MSGWRIRWLLHHGLGNGVFRTIHLNDRYKRRKGLLSKHSQSVGIESLHLIAAQKQQTHREEEYQLFSGIHSCYKSRDFDGRMNTGNWKGRNGGHFVDETPDVVSVGIKERKAEKRMPEDLEYAPDCENVDNSKLKLPDKVIEKVEAKSGEEDETVEYHE